MDGQSESRRRGRRWAAASLLVATAWAPLATAQDWRFEPVFRAGAEYDDNAELSFRTDDEVELEGLLAEISAGFIYTSPKVNFDFTPRLLSRNYSDEPQFDSDDLFLTSSYRWEGVTQALGFRVNYDEQQIRNAERANADIDVDDPDDILDDDSGRVGVLGDRARWRLAPFWDYQLSELSTFSADVDYRNVTYDEEEQFAGTLDDYTDTRLNLAFRRSLSPSTTGVILATARQFDVKEGLQSDTEGYGAMVGLERELSQVTFLRALVGFESADRDDLPEAETEVTADISLRRRLETINLLARYSREINASGSGQPALRDSINLSAQRSLSEKIDAGIGVTAYRQEPLGDQLVALEDRRYVQIRSRFTWYFTRTLSMQLDYRYTVIDRGQFVNESANSNAIDLWFAYAPGSYERP